MAFPKEIIVYIPRDTCGVNNFTLVKTNAIQLSEDIIKTVFIQDTELLSHAKKEWFLTPEEACAEIASRLNEEIERLQNYLDAIYCNRIAIQDEVYSEAPECPM